jgi:putative intracellular protease/amidase
MSSMKDISSKCILVLVAEGFDENETVMFLSLLRQAGLCVKSVGQVSGLVGSMHGVWLMPDLNLIDLDQLNWVDSINAVILPWGRQSLARLESDPRVHKVLRQVVANRGYIITSKEGLRVIRAATVWYEKQNDILNDLSTAVILREPEELTDSFVKDLVRRLQPSRP